MRESRRQVSGDTKVAEALESTGTYISGDVWKTT